MSIKCIKETYPDVYETIDKEALKWVFKSKRLLQEKFNKKFPRSPFQFVAQIKTERSSVLVNDKAEIRQVNKVAFLSWQTLKRLGCPTSF